MWQLWLVRAYTISMTTIHPNRYQLPVSPLLLRPCQCPPAHPSHWVLKSTADSDANTAADDDANGDDDDNICVSGGSGNDEEECEIDWSKMPGFDNDDTHNSYNKNSATSENDDEVQLLRVQLERQFQIPSTTSTASEDNDRKTTDTSPKLPQLELEDITIAAQSSSSSMMSDFQRLEMIWQQREESTECDIYEPITCGGQTCTTCSGTGHTVCRFCRGTKFLYLPITSDVLLTKDPDNNMRKDDFEVTQRPLPKSPAKSKNSSYVSCSICHTTGTEICRTCQGSGWIAHWTQLGVRVGDILK
jgi:hypothetical protein